MSQELFKEEPQPSFEDFKNENGFTYWWATDLMKMLGYKDMKSFGKAIDRATKACISLNIPHYTNIVAQERELGGSSIQDFKLTRFACYLVVMNADPRRVEVAQAQAYFAEQTRKFEILVQNSEDFERLLYREEIKEGHKALNVAAKQAGVQDFARFANAGYMGLYNMQNWQLAKRRKIDSKELHNYMGRAELAANLFRITQTEERIKNFKVKGQQNLEQTHYTVGREVRDMVQKNTGTNPENLPIGKNLNTVQKELKDGHKKMLQEDKKKKLPPSKKG
jgi:DNA-damage-inducible protein D